jgi:hypothetical protein
MARALKQLVCPQSTIHGWLGLILLPMVYALLEPNPFLALVCLGNLVVYPQFALSAQIKTADAMVARAQNKWKSYKNIQCACFCMLDENVTNQFKVLNMPTLTGWNTSMSIREILNQLEGTYGKPDIVTLFANDKFFRSPFNLVDAPEALFYRIEQCQEIQILARDPYSDMQVINNAVHFMMQASIFPLKEFNNWEAITAKTYPALKTFIAAAYTRHILAQQLRNTARQQGYVPTSHNMYNMFAEEDNKDTTATTMTNIVALMTGSIITVTIPDSVANAINQLSTNQTALMNTRWRQCCMPTYPPSNPTIPTTNPTTHHSGAATFHQGHIVKRFQP